MLQSKTAISFEILPLFNAWGAPSWHDAILLGAFKTHAQLLPPLEK